MNQLTGTVPNGVPSESSNSRAFRSRTAMKLIIILVGILASAVGAYSTAIPTALAGPNQGQALPMQVNVASRSVSISVTASVPSTQSQQLHIQASASMTTMRSTSSASSSRKTTAVQTSTSVTISQTMTSSVTSQTMTTTSQVGQSCGYGCYQYYPYPPYYPGYPGYYGGYPSYPAYVNAYGACGYGVGYSNNVQCTGYIYEAPNGCVELVIQIVNPYSYTSAQQYYTLHNLSSTPPSGTLVTVQGQMYQGYNTSSIGAACPGNYINVSSITTA